MKKIVFLFKVIVLFLIIGNDSLISQAGISEGNYSRINRSLWKNAKELPPGSVLAIVQAKNGYLWLGTQKGLLRFDGTEYVQFDSENTPPLKNNIVQTLLETRDGSLWIGTAGGGAVRFRNGEFTNFSIAEGLSDNFVQAFCEMADGTLFVGTGKGLDKINQSSTNIESIAELREKTVNALLTDKTGTLWIGSYGSGLYALAQNRVSNYTTKNGLISNYLWSLGIDGGQNLWIGTRDGISRHFGGEFESFNNPASGFKQTVYAILTRSDKSVWFGTDAAGIIKFDGANWSSDGEQNGLPSNSVYALATDCEENVWAGTLGGAAQLIQPKFAMLTPGDGLRGSITSAVYQDRAGNLWLGTDKGLNLFKNGQFVESFEEKTIGQKPIYSILEDSNGKLWVGTKGGGLFCFENGRVRHFDEKNGLAGDIIFSLLQTRAGKLWAGTYGGGLCEFLNDKFHCYGEADGLLSNLVSYLFEDRDGNLWIVGKNGLSRFASGQFTNYPNSQNGLPNAEVYSVSQTSDGAIWVGTDGGGLGLFEDGQFKVLRQRDGLASDSIFNLLEDEAGFLWLSGSQGVSRVNLAELKRAMSGDLKRINAVSFDAGDGLLTENCVGGSQSTAQRANDGHLWFGTIRGAAVIDTRNLKFNQYQPPVIIENLTVNDQSTPLRDSVSLSADAVRFAFRYAALSFTNSEKVRFRYRLEGFDHDWIDAGSERIARYTNLPPGNYTFRVAAANNDGVWNESGASITFNKQPFFYQTAWFYVLSAIGLIVAGIGLYHFRARREFRKIKEKHQLVLRERTRLAREVHDTLTQGLSGVLAQLQAAQSANAKGLPDYGNNHLKIARELTGESLVEARNWIRILSDDPPDNNYLSDALRSFAQKIEKRNSIIFHYAIEDLMPTLPPETTENILRIAQEAINNAVKHALAANLQIELHHNFTSLILSVTDDGCGFETKQIKAGGFGQRSMKERADVIGAELFIKSKVNGGTIVQLVVPTTTNNFN